VVVLALLGGLLVAPHGSAAVLGDDYPASLKKPARDAKVDPWHFYNRECTSFVAWRINDALGFAFDDYWLVHWGNASNWKKAATSAAVKKAGVTVDNNPSVGSVAWWGAGSAGSSVGHVAWVAVVSSSSITVEEYNYARAGYYGTRVISRSSAKWPGAFIHFKPAGITNTAAPKISGTPKVGLALTASTGSWSLGSLTYKYQWLANGAAIAGATGRTYTPGPDQYNQKITVRVSAARSGYKTVNATSASTAAIDRGSFTNKTGPAIVGTARVGSSITASPGTWSPAGNYHYQWKLGSEPIAGAKSATYTPTAAELGKKLSVAVSVTGKSMYTGRKATSAVTVAPGVFVANRAPALSGSPQVGRAFTVSLGSWAPAPSHFAVQWYLDGKAIKGATRKTFTPRPSDLGKKLTARVTVTRAAFTTSTVTLTPASAVAAGTNTATRVPAITGTRTRGHVLTVRPGTWQVTPTKRQYRWYADGVAIAGATGRTLKLSKAQVGHRITVAEGVTATGYRAGRATSASTAPIVNGAIAFTHKATITGSARPGSTLTAHAGRTTPAGTKLSYQWYRGTKAIPGATTSKYRVVAADLGSRLRVQVTATATWWRTATQKIATSQPVRTTPTMRVTTAVTGHRLAITVQITAPLVAQPGGHVIVTEGTHRLARVLVTAGRAKITVRGMASGRHHLKIRYIGTPKVATAKATRSVKVL